MIWKKELIIWMLMVGGNNSDNEIDKDNDDSSGSNVMIVIS